MILVSLQTEGFPVFSVSESSVQEESNDNDGSLCGSDSVFYKQSEGERHVDEQAANSSHCYPQRYLLIYTYFPVRCFSVYFSSHHGFAVFVKGFFVW